MCKGQSVYFGVTPYIF
uniref:Uncharacterized protein n=1 Tax=Bacillus subtilis TaxID=1423 RepID=Q45663_BACIU|nr:SacR [Cloning vector pMV5]CAA26512.1 unnamed protein product [Bacillus subtilis]